MDRREPQRRRRLRARLRQDCAARQRSASPDQFPTYGHHRRELFRRGRLPKYVAVILVTGGTGFIGTHLLEMLAARGENVRALVRIRTPRGSRVRRELPAGVETVYGDLESGAGLAEALGGADVLIHLAGVTKALRPRDYYDGNVRATEQLVHAMTGQGMRLVHVSSLAAMGPARPGAPLVEDAEPHPLTHYGKSKLLAERVVRDLAPDAVIVRPPVVYGPRGRGGLSDPQKPSPRGGGGVTGSPWVLGGPRGAVFFKSLKSLPRGLFLDIVLGVGKTSPSGGP